MGTSLTGLTPATTYDALIKVGDNGPLSATAKVLSDGLGNDSPLAMSTTLVGIGTATPTLGKLSVKDSNFQYIAEPADTATFGYLGVGHFNNGAYIGTNAGTNTVSDILRLGTTGTERMRITSAGNVGIGTATPTGTYGKLTVQGTGITLGADGEGKVEIGRYSAGAQNSYIKIGSTSTSLRITNSADQYDIFVIENNTTGEKLRLLQGGGITFNGDTSQANALDDYEEGTWTMGVSFGGASVGVTTSANTGTYTKIGRQVTVNGYLELTSKGSSTGSARITGLPFSIPNLTQNYATAGLYFGQITFANQFQGYGVVNTTTIQLDEITILGVITPIENGDFANNSVLMINYTYFTA